MMHFRKATLVLDKKEYALTPGKINSFDTFYVDFQCETSGPFNGRYTLFIHPKQDVLVEKIELQFEVPAQEFTNIVTYALHSAGASAAQGIGGRTGKQEGLFKNDPFSRFVPVGEGMQHAWSYMLFKGPVRQMLAASANESAGFTAMLYDAQWQTLTVTKDVGKSMRMTHSFPAMDFWYGTGGFEQVIPGKASGPLSKALIWSTNKETDLAQLPAYLDEVADSGLPFTHFCIGSGWQAHHGDWLNTRKLPQLPLARMIRDKGLVPMITYSPFTAAPDSELVRKNPEWLVQHDGKPVVITTASGGDAYVLDVYHSHVREYVSAVLYNFETHWGIHTFLAEDLVAACAVPKSEKNRGQIMQEAVSLLCDHAPPNRYILAGQVPLGAVPGHFDAVQMGKSPLRLQAAHLDIHLDSGCLDLEALLAAQFLRQAQIQVAGAPIALRPSKDTKNACGQYTFLIANALLTDVLTISDHLGSYTPEIRAELEDALFWWQNDQVSVQHLAPKLLKIRFNKDKTEHTAYLNLSGKKVAVNDQNRHFELGPLESLVF